MNKQKQQGVTLSGLLVVCVVLITVAIIGFKLFPAYNEYLKVKRTITAIAKDPEANRSVGEAKAAFARRTAIDDIKAIQDLDVTKTSNGVAIAANWSVKVPLFYNVSACMDFEARSQ